MSKKTRKGENGSARFYETVVVFDAPLPDETVKAVVEKIKEIITSHGSTVSKVDEWGKRKLAYMINKKTYGQYVCVEFQGAGETVKALTDFYHITEVILRHMTMLIDSRLRAERQREKLPPKEAVIEEPRF